MSKEISFGSETETRLLWGNLIHLSYNMWSDVPLEAGLRRMRGRPRITDHLLCDKRLFHDMTERMAQSGFNTVVLDLGDAVRYESHPEIAVKGAWSTDELRDELVRLRQLGLEPLPKLNFSAAHDAWLGDYSRMVATPKYYEVCQNLIAEMSALFDTPRLFHIGMDEETLGNQSGHHCVIIRQGELWWHDLHLLADAVRASGVRPWMWADMAWQKAGEYYEKMPRDMMQSNWWYGLWFEGDEANRPRKLRGHEGFLTHLDLDEHGFDQIPTASTWQNRFDNFALTVEYCLRRVCRERLKGFLQTTWLMTTEDFRDEQMLAIDVAGRAIRACEAGLPLPTSVERASGALMPGEVSLAE